PLLVARAVGPILTMAPTCSFASLLVVLRISARTDPLLLQFAPAGQLHPKSVGSLRLRRQALPRSPACCVSPEPESLHGWRGLGHAGSDRGKSPAVDSDP